MAYCTTYTFFRVKGAGVTDINGYYYPVLGVEANGKDSFVHMLSFATSGYPRLELANLSGSHYSWGLFTAPYLSAYRSQNIYTTTASAPTCPDSLTWVHGTTKTGTLPTALGKTIADRHRDLISSLA